MLTLIVRQTLTNGLIKTWKLRPTQSTYTFGSSRLAQIISISQTTPGIQGVFEYRKNKWWYIDMNLEKATENSMMSEVCLDEEKILKFQDSQLLITPVSKEVNLFLDLEKSRKNSNQLGKEYQLYIVRQGKTVIETKILPRDKKFKSSVVFGMKKVTCVPGPDWHEDILNDISIRQRSVSLDDVSDISHLSLQQLVDQDSKKSLIAVLAAGFLIVVVGLLSPKNEKSNALMTPPVVAQKIIVKTEIKPKRKTASNQPKTSMPQVPEQKVIPKEVAASGGGSKVANMMKSLQGGRISQLLGKVSAQAAKSGNVVIATGVKAGTGPSGRALASVGNIEKSGRNWGAEGNGTGVTISTAGRGGGKATSGMGGLTAGGTGSAGVGLIEDEGEITGGLDREIIAQYIKSKLGQILYCYERQLSANPDLFGKVAVKFTIAATGSVEQQLIGDTTLKNSTVEGCILNRVAAWKFPQPQGGTRVLVTYPFLFKSTN